MVLSAAWLTFAPEGGAMWIVGRGAANGNHATLTAYRAVPGAGQFGSSATPATSQIEFWGTLTVVFGGCDLGHVQWTPDVGSYAIGETDIVRVTQAAGLPCTPGSTAQSRPGDKPGTTMQFVPGRTPLP